MNKKVKTKISTLFMLVVLLAQTLTPVVTVFAEDTTSTQASSEVQTLNETTSQIQIGQGGTTVSSTVPVVPDSTPPSTTASSEVSTSTEVTSESPTSESQEVAATEEAAEEDEEPAQGSTKANKQSALASDIDVASFITSMGGELHQDGKDKITLENGGLYDIDPEKVTAFQLKFSFNFNDDDLFNNMSIEDSYYFDLPELFIGNTITEPVLLERKGIIIGHYTIDANGRVAIQFNDNFIKGIDREFDLDFSRELNVDLFNEDRHQKVEIPLADGQEIEWDFSGKSDDLTGEDKKEATVYKFINNERIESQYQATHADWKITVNDLMNRYENAKITDIIQEGHKLDTTSLKVWEIKRDPKGNELDRKLVPLKPDQIDSNGFVLSLGAIDETYEIHYTTLIDQKEEGAEQTEIKNSANIELDGESKDVTDSEFITWGESKDIISKSTSGYKVGDALVPWEVQYNYGNTKLGETTILTDSVDIGFFDLESLSLEIREVTVDNNGQTIVSSEKLSEDKYTVSIEGDQLVITIPDSEGKGYKLNYNSQLPIGLENQIVKNNVIANDPSQSSDAAEETVTTTPTVSKQVDGDIVVIDGEAYINWKVEINSKGYASEKPFVIEDTFNSAHLELVEESFTLNDNPISNEDGTMVPKDDQSGFTVTIDPVKPQKYTLKYQTKVTEIGLKEGNLENNANFSWGTGEGIGSGENVGKINPGVTKRGIYRYDEKLQTEVIDWTVTFNERKLKLNPTVKVQDIFSDSSLKVIDQKFEITRTPNNQVVAESDYKYTPIESGFELEFLEGVEAETYTIKYSTNAPTDSEGNETNVAVTNTATLIWQDGTDSKPATVESRKPGINKWGSVELDGTDKRKNQWVIEFNSNKHIIYDLILNDKFTPESSQLIGDIVITEGGTYDPTTNRVSGGNTLKKEDYTYSSAANSFEVRLAKTKPVKYYITYYTTRTAEDEKFDAVNTVSIKGRGTGDPEEKSATNKKPELTFEKRGVSVDKTTDPRRINWEIKVNTSSPLVSLEGTFVEDTIPKDQKLDWATMQVFQLNGESEVLLDLEKLKTDHSLNRFNITLPDGIHQYRIEYQTEILAYPSVNTEKDKYTNTVQLVDTHQGNKGLKEGWIKYFDEGNNTPVKTGNPDLKTDTIEWTVEVNQAKLPLIGGNIFDQLNDGKQTYVEDSLEVKVKNSTGDYDTLESNQYTPTFANNTEDKDSQPSLTITFNERLEEPKETQNNITQTYQITYKTALKPHVFGRTAVSNTIALTRDGTESGDFVDSKESSVKTEKWHYGGGGSSTKINITTKKVDADSKEGLSGVKFNLSYIKPDNKQEIIGENLSSVEAGKLILSGLWYGRFVLEETTARPGYDKIPELYFGLRGNQTEKGKSELVFLNSSGDIIPTPGFVEIAEDGTLIIKNERIKSDITAKKVWVGGGFRPTVWFTLYRQVGNGEANKVENTEIKELKDPVISVTWKGLPKFNDEGSEYTYFVKETNAKGEEFTPDYYSKEEDGLTVKNTFKQKEVEVKFNKVWKDFDNAHKTRPNEIYIRLLQNNNLYGEVVTLPMPGTVGYWGYTFTKLPEINPSTGVKHTYSVVETDKDGNVVTEIEGNNGNMYDVKIETVDPEGNTTIRNTLRNKTSVSGEKIWSGEGGYKEFARPDSIMVELYDGFNKIRETKISQGSDGEWGYKFENLPKYDSERLIAYTVKEVTVPGYDTSITDTTITNTLKTTEISAKKVWDDASDQSSRPDSITFELLAQVEGVSGVTKIAEHELEKPKENPDTWSYTFENLPTHNKEGKKFIYTVREKTVPDGSYATSETEIVDGVYQITNTLIAEDELIIKKVWEDQTDTSSRPAFIEVQLYRQVDGKDKEKVGEPRKLTPKDELNPLDWQIKFTGLAASDKEGNKYNYFVEEVTHSASYLEPKISKEGQVSTITNTLDSVNIPVGKIWDDSTDLSLRPDSVTVDLYRQIEGEDTVTKVEGHSLTLSEADSWKGQFTGLAKEDKSGNAYIYSVQEQAVKGYTPTVVPGLKDGFVITNKLDLTEISVTKVWDDISNKYGLRPQSIELSLMVKQGEQLVPVTKKVKNSEGQIVEEEVKLTLAGDMAATEWTGKFENLTKFDYAGQLVQYYVLETAIKAYKEVSVQKVNDKQQVSITNELRKTEIPVTKTWSDEEDYFGLRPESIKVSLYQNGKAFDKVAPFDITPDKDGNWSHTFADLPEVDAEGNAYKYTIFESTVHGYEGTINQNTGEITNSLVTVDVPVTKVWEDTFHEEADYYNLRPDSITVRLLQNGKEIAQVPAAKVVDKDGSWSHVFKDLPKFDKTGTPYEYTVTEDEDPRYKTEISGGVITNTLKTTEIPVTKAWLDEGDYFGLRPESIKVSLYQNGKAFDKVAPFDITPDKDGNWTHTFTDLPEVDAEGNAYEYTIFESTVHGYEGTIDQKTGKITNSLVTIDIPVTKVWEDTFKGKENYYQSRPESITVRLLQNGKEIAQVPAVKVVDKDGSWSHVFKDLPKFDKTGKPYEYTITEDEDPRYKTEIQNGVITNTLKTTEVPVIKTWLDENNRFGLRPEEITVSLYQNDKLFEAVAPFVIKADKDGNWTHTFTDLPEIDAEGNAYEYTIFESEVTGYEGTIDQKTGEITNSLVTIDIPVTKVWEDTFKGKENYYQSRPESITIRLKQNGKEIAQVPEVKVVDKDGNWSHVFKDLPKLDKDGKAYEYEVTEDAVDKYNTKIDVNESNEVTITNTRKTYAIGDYTWIDSNNDGIQGEDEEILEGVIVELFDETGKIKLDETTTDKYGRYIFDELEDGKYTIKFTLTKEQSEMYEFTKQDSGKDDKVDSDADELTGWTTTITLNDDSKELTKDYEIQDFKATEGIDPTWDAGVILREKIEVTGTKVWVGGPKVKPTIEFQLYRNGEAFGKPVELKDGTTTYTWKDLYKTDTNKEPYVYTVQEVGTPSEYNKVEKDLTVTNTRKTYAIGDYTWIDTDKDGIQDKNEPVLPGVKVELFDENGKKIAETTTDKNGRYLFDELESGKYKVKFTLTDEQKKRYKFTKRHSGETAKDSNADNDGWTIDIDLNENNAFLTLDYTDQTFKASEGIDPTWDAGVILLDVPVKPTDPKDPKPELPQMGEAGNPFLLTSLGILLIGSVVGVVTTRRRRQG